MRDCSFHPSSDQTLIEAFSPFVKRRYEPEDAEWVATVRKARVEQSRLRFRRRALGWLHAFRRTQRGVNIAYSEQWARGPVEQQLTKKSDGRPFVFRGRGFLASGQGEKRVHHRILFDAITQLSPRRVLEVGSGNGLNLLMLASWFPAVQFTGLELTRGGVGAAARVRGMSRLPIEMREFAVEPLRDEEAHRGVTFIQGSAAALPFTSRSFDLVYSVLALEQMEEIRNAALAEVARVSGGHVLMLEPFRDWNNEQPRRDYIVAHDYFSAWVADLPLFGMKVVHADEIPAKLARGAGQVLAEIVR